MTKVKMTEEGTILPPKEVRDRRSFSPGTEFEVIDGGREIVLKPVGYGDRERDSAKLTLEEFLAMRIPCDGPPLTDEMIRESIDGVARKDWARLERQWHGDKDD